MKKELLVMAAVVGLLTTASAQTYIKGSNVVKVEKNTLFYNGAGLYLTGDEDNIVINDGNIIVEGKFISNDANGNVRKGGAFLVNTYTDKSNYGQLQILKPTTVTGSMGIQKPAIDPDKYAWGQFAIPFEDPDRKASDLMKDLFGKDAIFVGGCPVGSACGPRLKQSMMVWNNTSYMFDAVPSNAVVDPKAYYILNLHDANAGIKGVMETNLAPNARLTYKGQPSPGLHKIDYTSYVAVKDKAWGDWKGDKNVYGETYGSYIGDIKETASDASTIFGKNIYQIGNPYTSNVDLTTLASVVGIDAVAKVGAEVKWNASVGAIESPTTHIATYDVLSSNWVGEGEPLLLRPFEGVIIKLKEATAAPFVFNFVDSLKTFGDATSATVTFASVTSATVTSATVTRAIKNVRGASNNSFYQLGLALVDKSTQKLTDNRVYVATGSSMVTGGERGSHEAAYSDFNNRTGIYLLQENLDETANTSEKLFINTINDGDYVGKPIALGFNAARDNKGTYVIKSRLSEGNLALLDAENYSDGSTFYFHDKKKDFVTEVTSDFSYEFTETESTNDRFVIYWNDVPESLGVGETINKSSTIVYKDGDDHKVRFNKGWKAADISVYDLSGRLVLNKAKVATTADYTVRLPKNVSSVYIIKVVGDNGDVVTKKIVKK